ncbi:hypothetical protein [Actinoalloteichus caeruleus]|uniref:hypothetical protein n=1 Tax=Actinoalloteichus cyanogriseus TaxID=2893586 RepID=UPI003AB0BF96
MEQRLDLVLKGLISDYERDTGTKIRSMRHLARLMTDAGYPVSHGTLTGILNGRLSNDATKRSLAAFFQVHPSRFELTATQARVMGRLAALGDLTGAEVLEVDRLLGDLAARRERGREDEVKDTDG